MCMVETAKPPTAAVGWDLLAGTAPEWAGPGPSGAGLWAAGPRFPGDGRAEEAGLGPPGSRGRDLKPWPPKVYQ